MGNVDKTAPSLKVEIIVSAVSGDPIAITEVLHHYQKYIMSLSLRSNYDDGSTSG